MSPGLYYIKQRFTDGHKLEVAIFPVIGDDAAHVAYYELVEYFVHSEPDVLTLNAKDVYQHAKDVLQQHTILWRMELYDRDKNVILRSSDSE